jgi:hypothetical protein
MSLYIAYLKKIFLNLTTFVECKIETVRLSSCLSAGIEVRQEI